jgi:hypothetical protein
MLALDGTQVIVAGLAALPGTIGAIATLVVVLRFRTENREQHQAVVEQLAASAEPAEAAP